MRRIDIKEQPNDSGKHHSDLATQVYRWVLIVLQLIMAVELVLVIYEKQWVNAFLVMGIMAITLSPAAIGRRFKVDVPAEFQVLAVIFVFSALFLGEVQSYYLRIWWWDIALHTSSGLLTGLLGFLLVYVLNESDRVDIHMRPRFVAMFAFMFAVAVGTIWEIFEFSMDMLAGTDMQKSMFSDPSGLTDTMWDMIVNAFGALVISGLGWWYMHQSEHSFIEAWISKFIERNPRLFRR